MPELSKNALKKQKKAQEAARKKAEKDAKKKAGAAAKPAKKKAGPIVAVGEDELDPTAYFENRTKLLAQYAAKGNNPYPHKFDVQMQLSDFVQSFEPATQPGDRLEAQEVSVAGRIDRIREQGKLLFIDIVGDDSKVQLMTDGKTYEAGVEAWTEVVTVLRRGDIVGVRGYPGKSNSGELSIFPKFLQLLSPCMRMIPKNGIKNIEVRYRQRYLDLILNRNTRRVFEVRARIINYIRRFLDEREFLEVETPMLNMVHGGATARPFKTVHNELNIDMYMRVAPELYLKMLIVGGLDRVYEIGRQFRNEGMDHTHNPEFTTCEFYQAYADYKDLMDMTEQLVSGMVKDVTGDYKVTVGGGVEVDFTPPFRRVSMLDGVKEEVEKKHPGITVDFPNLNDRDASMAYLIDLFSRIGVTPKPPLTVARLVDQLVSDYVEPGCINPTFIMDHPEVMSPLAKYHRDRPGLTERFELFVNTKELLNAYTELNNPVVQRERFAQQGNQGEEDPEAMVKDEDFCVALEHALPPTAGWGMGIDRMTMFLTGNESIREVLLFPAMKPINYKPPQEAPEPASGGGGLSAAAPAAPAFPACPSAPVPCLNNTDLGTAAGLAVLNGLLNGRNFVAGTAPTSADAEILATLDTLPLAAKVLFPQVKRYYQTCSLFLPPVRATWPAPSAPINIAAPPPAPSPAPTGKPKKVAAAAAEEEEIDLGFGDEEEIDLGFDEEEPAEEKAPSMKERAAAAKAERDAKLEEAKQKAMERLAKKEAKQRSLCSLEIKPWEADQDLMALFVKIKETMVREGLKWGENCQLVPVAFGIKKMLLTAVISQTMSMDEIIEEMTEETFADEIQSMEMTSMSLL